MTTHMPLSVSLVFADWLGTMEYSLAWKGNRAFTQYMEGMLRGTKLEGQVEMLKRKCCGYRYRSYVARHRQIKSPHDIPLVNRDILGNLEGGTACFPVVHFGFFYLGFWALGTHHPTKLFLLSKMREPRNGMEESCFRIKRKMLEGLPAQPLFSSQEIKEICFPAVRQKRACYAPTFDAVTRTTKEYNFLSGRIHLTMEPTIKFCAQHAIPLAPFFTVGDDIRSSKTIIAPAYIPEPDKHKAAEDWFLNVLEKYVIEHPSSADWFYWWRNSVRFDNWVRS